MSLRPRRLRPPRIDAHQTFSSLYASRNYRRWYGAQSISLAGTWMQTIAQGWLVLELTGSGTAVGLVTAFQFVPVLLLGPIGGVVVDRLDKRNVVLFTQTASGVLALVLGLLVVTDVVQLWMVYALAFCLGILTTVDNPARQTFVNEMVGPDQLTNAVTLGSVNINAARVVGPAIAAGLIAWVGVGPCFLVNAASYIAVVAALLTMRVAELHPAPRSARERGQLVEGLRYVWGTPPLRVSLLMMALIGTLAYEFQVILPIMARYTFGGSASTYGVMTGAMGLGAVIGGLATASRNRHGVAVLVRQAAWFGVLILVVAVAPTLITAVLALVLVGAASITFLARANTTVQLGTQPVFRGRVMALWTVAFLGTTPVGGPTIGWIGEHAGPRWGLASGGASCLVASGLGWLALRRDPAVGFTSGTAPTPPEAELLAAVEDSRQVAAAD